MPRIRRLLTTVAALALVLAPAVPATASVEPPARPGWAALPGDTSDFTFRSFDAVYTLTRMPDQRAALDVVETAVAVFPAIDQNRGILRSIPDYYGDVYLDTTVLGVTDENGDDVYYEVQNDGGFTILVIDDDEFKHGATTYVIHYTQTDTIRNFADTGDDEFYWDVNGTGWDQPFGEVSAEVRIGSELAPALTGQNACYEGPDGSSTPCSAGVTVSAGDTETVITAAARDLAPRENLTVVVGFTSGTFVEGTPDPNGAPYEPNVPTGPEIDLGPPPSLWAVLLGLLGGAASFVIGMVALAVLRRPRARATGFIIPQYSVPKDLDVMLAAELIEKRETALQAQFVSLAVKKKIRLLGYPVTDADEADYAVQLLDRSGLESWEQAVVDGLFGVDAEVGATRDLKRAGDAELADALRPIVNALPAAIPASGFIGPSASTRGSRWFVLSAVGAAVLGIVGAILSGWVGVLIGIVSFGFSMVGLIAVGVAARKRPTLSEWGAHQVDYLLGMKMYLELAEKDRFAVLQSATGADRIDTTDGRQIVKLYEKLLPWAVIWGVEDSWARELEIQLQQTGEEVDWYVSTTPFQWYAFSSFMSGLSSGTHAPVSDSSYSSSGSSWSSSGFSSFSGGSGGGGFSGGGGGGGGGGGR